MTSPENQFDVLIIGGGPAGLSAATELKKCGIARVVVLEREPQAGGIPRHCGHPPFGMREFKRLLTGPQYAARLVNVALGAGVEIRYHTTVVAAKEGGELHTTSPTGLQTLHASRVIYATGVRETPRSARLVSGQRPQGVLNTGALQSLVYLHQQRPFRNPIIIGSELVAFSAIMTCRHAGIRPLAMIEANSHATARWPTALYAPLSGTPLKLNTQLITINGNQQVESVTVADQQGQQREIECDGVILSGRFTPEANLALSGHLAVDPGTGGPQVDQYGRCSDPSYFATGNLLRPVETAGWSWQEGKLIGGCVANDLAGKLPSTEPSLPIVTIGPTIKYALPQRLSLPNTTLYRGMQQLQLRFTIATSGQLSLKLEGQTLWQKHINTKLERRFLIPLKHLPATITASQIEIQFIDDKHP